MALKTVINEEAYNGLKDALKEEYTKGDDGNYYLDAEDIDAHPKVKGLKSAFEKQKEEVKGLKKQAEKYKDVDPDKYAELMQKITEAEEKEQEKKGEWDQMKQRLIDNHTKELKKKDDEIAQRDSYIERITFKDRLDEAIVKAGVIEQYRPAVRALLREKQNKVIRDGEEYKGVFLTDVGEVEVGEFVSEWAKSDEAAHYLPAERKGGSGAPPQGGQGGGGKAKTFDRNDPLAWGQNADAVAKGNAQAV